MDSQITLDELAHDLIGVLDRVQRNGERITIVRGGECVAVLSPARNPPGITVDELIARVGDLEMPGDGFADDLEAIHANQPVAVFPEWPD